jgi:hypothetical protein
MQVTCAQACHKQAYRSAACRKQADRSAACTCIAVCSTGAPLFCFDSSGSTHGCWIDARSPAVRDVSGLGRPLSHDIKYV